MKTEATSVRSTRPRTGARLDSTPCLACGAASWSPLHRVLAECTSCGFVRADMQVSAHELRRLYSEDYFRGEEYGNYLADAQAHRRNFERRFERMAAISGGFRGVFEVGCAYGFWLECASRHGLEAAGVDVCDEAVAYATGELGQQASAGDFLQTRIEPGKFDAFVMWDTIEHLAEPERFVSRIVELLPSGGWFFCTTGDIGARIAQRQGPRWRMIHPPTHLQYFSAETMRRFLKRQKLEVVALESTPIYRTLRGSIECTKVLTRGWTRTAARVLDVCIPRFVQERVGFWLDLGDIMFVAARKPSG
jgi:2-polyprenyl-3-methyl-5-hydroxy-6-metoxy-1,4-benzoquinol methylase